MSSFLGCQVSWRYDDHPQDAGQKLRMRQAIPSVRHFMACKKKKKPTSLHQKMNWAADVGNRVQQLRGHWPMKERLKTPAFNNPNASKSQQVNQGRPVQGDQIESRIRIQIIRPHWLRIFVIFRRYKSVRKDRVTKKQSQIPSVDETGQNDHNRSCILTIGAMSGKKNATLRRVRVTTVAVEKQQVLDILTVCL